jgi:hypothetical protein
MRGDKPALMEKDMKKTLALCVLPFLALPVAMPAFAAPTTVSNIEVKTDLDAIQNPAAARYWSNISADLKDAIAARLVDHIDPAGAKVEIDLDELALSPASLTDAVLQGQVNVSSETDNTDFDGYNLKVTASGASTGMMEDYRSIVSAFADAVANKLIN